MSIEEKTMATLYHLDRDGAHITIETEACRDCELKPCLYICPVENYKLENNLLILTCDACVECGACRVACPKDAIKWSYPRGGFGVCFRYG